MKDNHSERDYSTADKAGNFLKRVISLGINGGGGLSSAKELGDQYLQKPEYKSRVERIDALIKWEERKNFTSGFLTGLGGIISMPVTIPASLGINWVLQIRMVAAMAYIGGFDIDDPPVRMSIALCLLGKRGKEVLNTDTAQLTEMLKKRTFTQLPKQSLQLINQTIASKLMQLATAKGFSRLSKAIPLMGGVVGGILDYKSCHDTAQFAKELFQFHLGIEIDHETIEEST